MHRRPKPNARRTSLMKGVVAVAARSRSLAMRWRAATPKPPRRRSRHDADMQSEPGARGDQSVTRPQRLRPIARRSELPDADASQHAKAERGPSSSFFRYPWQRQCWRNLSRSCTETSHDVPVGPVLAQLQFQRRRPPRSSTGVFRRRRESVPPPALSPCKFPLRRVPLPVAPGNHRATRLSHASASSGSYEGPRLRRTCLADDSAPGVGATAGEEVPRGVGDGVSPRRWRRTARTANQRPLGTGASDPPSGVSSEGMSTAAAHRRMHAPVEVDTSMPTRRRPHALAADCVPGDRRPDPCPKRRGAGAGRPRRALSAMKEESTTRHLYRSVLGTPALPIRSLRACASGRVPRRR
ncbi:hypothetical protein DFJ74DRAFT_657188 [Hyaloraphidium curvatum]|nr:hypothetical protein DFJ74DRAFT_657188 [Hyaloraphidium curvatum]